MKRMKKTLTVNLGGRVFHIDEDAYFLLDKYLADLKHCFRKEEGAEEILKDLEGRISEVFQEKLQAGGEVVTKDDVEQMMARMGWPEELSGENAGQESRDTAGGPVPHRLYRDPDNKILGGVAGGFAAYFGWDATWVRVLMLLALVLPFVRFPIALVYVVCWMFIPLARTAAEKLAMRGERVTVESIGRTVADGFERASDGVNRYVQSGKPRNFLQKLGDMLVRIAGFLIKACLVLLLIAGIPFVLFVAFMAFVFLAVWVSLAMGGGAFLYSQVPSLEEWFSMTSPGMAFMAFFLMAVVGIVPLVGAVHFVLSSFFSWKPMGKKLKWTLFIVWLAAAVACCVLFAEGSPVMRFSSYGILF